MRSDVYASCDDVSHNQLHDCGKSISFYFQENPREGNTNKPYRKPTQVGELSIQRRSGELSLRNSAK